ncbi:MAG: tRNA (N6-threonylcarbamoyladenosine(37)-N6)-methyltransferase TrmO [Myxococcota bacterium]
MKKPPKDYIDAVPVPSEVMLACIGEVRSPFVERHGTPRQPGCEGPEEAGVVDARLELFPDRVHRDALHDLTEFSHLWVIAWLHLNGPLRKPMVRPPRGGPPRGVFSTRAPHRPNPIGLSATRLLRIEGHVVHVRGLDLLDRTPILDIKPYIPDYDRIDATRGWLGS